MFCTECGVKNPTDSKFCRQCGHKIDKALISEEAYTQALPSEGQIVELLETAYAQRKKNDLAGAVRTCERALQIAPDSAAAHSLLGQLYAAQGERERAIREYEQVLRLNPGSIADRVKLDELRDEYAQKKPRIAPALVIAGRETNAPFLMTLVSVGVVALVLVAAGVGMFRPAHSASANNGGVSHGSNPAQNPAVIANSPASYSLPADLNNTAIVKTGGKQGAATVGGVSSASATNPAQIPANASGPNAALSSVKGAAPYAPSNSLPNLPTVTLPGMNPAPAVPAAKAKPKKSAEPKAKSTPDTNNRIVLSGDESGSSNGERYVIRINTGGAGKPSGSLGQNSVVIRNNGGSAENPPASASRSSISIADDLRYKGEFDKALQMYQRALPGAGSRAAHVYHQMAYCFQSKGDRNSAKVNYERAIEAYQKQAAGGHDAEAAQSAIRVCQRGLKVCE